MKKITVIGYEKGTDTGHNNAKLSTIELEGPEEMDASDGYHSFSELYDHRITLYIALCKQISHQPSYDYDDKFTIWRSVLHSDGSNFDGYFVLGIGTEKGHQITYHLPNGRWNDTDFATTIDRAPEFDGHTPTNVLKRIEKL